VCLHKSARDCETQARTRCTGPPAFEWKEQSLAVGRCNAWPTIDDFHPYGTVLTDGARKDRRRGWRVEECILQQVGDHLVDLCVIARDGWELLRNIEADLATWQT
jgi:hypothetical protein